MSIHEECPFCRIVEEAVFYRGRVVKAVWDRFPVSLGHALVIPNRHVATWFDASPEEQAELTSAVEDVRAVIEDQYQPDGYNIGVNVGAAAGQTVFHLHLHVIPRYQGDVADPTGGVRHVIPEKGNYRGRFKVGADFLSGVPHHRSLVRGWDDPLLPHLLAELDRARRADFAVAFVLKSGIRPILEHLRDLLKRGGQIRMLTGDYLDVTEPEALLALMDLPKTLDVRGTLDLRVYEATQTSFHPKAYLFYREDGSGVAYVGSSNLTEAALRNGVEWNYRELSSRNVTGFQHVAEAFEKLFVHPATVPVDDAWVRSYQARRRPRTVQAVPEVGPEKPEKPPEPHAVQHEALAALEATRQEGNSAGLVVLATGLGKTWLAAFDSNREEFSRILFVAHREEILAQAMNTFRRIRPLAKLGLYTGTEKVPEADVLFASIQTLGKKNHLNMFKPDSFDYIVVDEFHHAAARTYRRLIDYFRPKFLLGLTATPERMDGGDLLGLCQENLVFRKDILEGIRAELLCPFHYLGVPDEVDYRNIPWRSTHFDEERLTEAVATRSRAKNALDQYRKHAGSRTLAFCCSKRHADFMAEFFREDGRRAVAVHSGESSSPRTSSLEQLEQGRLDVIFAVDMFNEGVDLPQVDTVMMLRPTESSIIWLQQFGRGLRKPDKEKRLTVIDYIGNHRTFLVKIRSLLESFLKLGAGDAGIDRALKAIESRDIELPPGCDVTYELEAVDIVRGLLRVPRGDEAIRAYYEDFRDRYGQRPTAAEMFHEGYSPRSVRASFGSWPRFVGTMSDLSDAEQRVLDHAGDFLDVLEKTQMTKSFKMLALLAMLQEDALPGAMTLDRLAVGFGEIAARSAALRADVGEAIDDPAALEKLVRENPIAAWAGGRGTDGRTYFAYRDRVFRSTLEIPGELREAFQEMVREIVDWRLAEYLQRPSQGSNGQDGQIICKLIHSGGRPILKLPDRDKTPGVPQGWTDVLVESQPHEANFAKEFVNVIRKQGQEVNSLTPILRGWFGDDAGRPGTRHHVAFRHGEDGYEMVPYGRAASNGGPELWRHYLREKIPGLYGLEFNTGSWNQGFVRHPGHLFLLVTLQKTGAYEQHQYDDQFLAADLFQWQSQNRTTRESGQGQELREHRQRGIDVHLFVRRRKIVDAKAAPFIYCGDVDFVDWRGDSPVTITWKLREAVPEKLREVLECRRGGDGDAGTR